MTRLNVWLVAVLILAGSALVWPVSARSAQVPNPRLILDTVKGTVEIELLQGDAPKSVEYILALVRKNFYRGLRFHRAERALVQVGDKASRDMTRKAWWGRSVYTPTVGVAEISKKLIHVRGTVGLAHSGDPRSANSQFYIMKERNSSLNGKYTIIGRVRVGMPVVDTIEVGDILKQVTIKGEAPQ